MRRNIEKIDGVRMMTLGRLDRQHRLYSDVFYRQAVRATVIFTAGVGVLAMLGLRRRRRRRDEDAG
jgi:hypothetical protein